MLTAHTLTAITPAPSAPEERLRSRMWTLIGCLPLRASGERRDTGSRREPAKGRSQKVIITFSPLSTLPVLLGGLFT
ncbi:hypothetical protein PGTUg99_029894 [Puccinia graminis f. sp. tritici]|uniref:Uncharacterized protein n=1 Tax=Puccinia graminis f. sp. tritici TaxID=56615 RepID=A0A5B0QM67_PUCGR|nr:hypothetical protein PGTUg99_029894 [Puccinia graminis f. sp. tritici]